MVGALRPARRAGDARRNPRLPGRGKAFKRILDRDGEPNNPCIVVAAAAGFGKLGAHDIFALVGKIEEEPLEYAGGIELSKADLYVRLGGPRGAQVLTEMWTRTIRAPRAAASGACVSGERGSAARSARRRSSAAPRA